MLTKQQLRIQLIEKRQNTDMPQRTQASALISLRLIAAVEALLPRTIHVFTPIDQLKEVNVTQFISWAHTCKEPLFTVHTTSNLRGEWIYTDLLGHVVNNTNYDVIIVPMLGFDSRLHRIGYGGGYYDRFLATQPQAVKIGVCFDFGFVADIENQPTDIALDRVITELREYYPV